ncbi:MAG: sulfopyruvate decarboxylase [Deltaproteobacteria bacterium]|nr:sulfopyruvate decarboxylase [Deltaproteobacteria bacterium]
MSSGSELILQELKRCGIRFVANLPDEWAGDLQEMIRKDPDITMIPVCREEEALAICAGIFLGGGRSALLIQSAGFFSAGNSIVSMTQKFQIPLFMMLSHVGTYEDDREYQVHKGLALEPVLEALRVPYYSILTKQDVPKLFLAHRYAYVASQPVAALLGMEVLTT